MTSSVTHNADIKIHPCFELRRQHSIESLKVNVQEFTHTKTGALHYHFSSDNPENVFLVALRTMPKDSTGVAHILEHTALCGSKHYPVRDPFFMMIRRSLNTFMNAFTSSDWTAYPFASQNRKDFNNLLDVYLDAVFFARLEPLDFAQEGHRMEFEEVDNPDSNLVYKGVVFNEMKGSMASPVSTLWQTLTKYIFPTTTYHHNSGGEPSDIPNLSYDAFMEFYRTHYHPSNAIFMTYGDIPAYQHQEKFENQALSEFDRLDKQFFVEDEKRYDSPLSVIEHYAQDDAQQIENNTHIVIGWLLGKSTNLEAQLTAYLLSGALLDNSACPLLNALETTHLGSAPSQLCGVEDSNREMVFMCGIQGSKSEHADALEKLVFDVLNDVANNGIEQDRMEAVLHQLELEQREVSGGSYPYGLQIILDALPSAVHRGDPIAALDLDSVLSVLREKIKQPEYIKNVARELLIDNPHRVRLVLEPDSELSSKRLQQEAEKLAEIKKQLSDEDKRKIIEQAKSLLQRQQQKDDESILPKVELKDIPDEMPIASGSESVIGTLKASLYEQGTNGLVYQQIITELPALDDHLFQLTPYYTNLLTELGCGGRDYLQTQALQSSISGGVSAYTSVRGSISDEQLTSGYFILSTKALRRKHKEMCQLLLDSFHRARFDELPRIRELIAQQKASREQSVIHRGHQLAMSAASSAMSPTAVMRHKLSGLAGIQHTKSLDQQLEDKSQLKQFSEELSQLHEAITQQVKQFLIIGETEHINDYVNDIERVWSEYGASTTSNTQLHLPTSRDQARQFWVTSTPINFCAKSYPCVPAEHPDSAALAVLGVFLRNGYLHTAIREQGGAYGGGASYRAECAAFEFYSYRDPRLQETLDDFDHSIQWLLEQAHQWQQVEEAILGVISGIDKPSSPAGEAKDAFHNNLHGRSPEQRQAYRRRILQVQLDDLRRVGETYFNPEKASTAVISNSAKLNECGDLGLEVHHV